MADLFSATIYFYLLSLIFIVLIIKPSKISGENALNYYETQNEISRQFDKTNNSLQKLIVGFREDKFLANFHFISFMQLPKNSSFPTFPKMKIAQCNVPKENLIELKNEINRTLSNTSWTVKQVNCEFNSTDSNNCVELYKLIQCGISHMKNGILEAMTNYESLNDTWAKTYNDLFQKYRRAIDDSETSVSENRKKELEKLKKNLQDLQNMYNQKLGEALNSKGRIKCNQQLQDTKTELKAIKEMLKSDFCSWRIWKYFRDDIEKFSKFCQLIEDIISHVHNRKVYSAIQKYSY